MKYYNIEIKSKRPFNFIVKIEDLGETDREIKKILLSKVRKYLKNNMKKDGETTMSFDALECLRKGNYIISDNPIYHIID